MSKVRIVNAHPSVSIIKAENKDDFLFSRYDETYPALPYRLASNTLGGNPTNRDFSPYLTWQREVIEEFNNCAPKGEELRDKSTPFAPLEDIIKVRLSILNNAWPYADFYFNTLGVSIEEYLKGIGKGLSKKEALDRLSEKKRREVIETGMITRRGGAIFSVFYSEIPGKEMDMVKNYLSKGIRLSTEGGNRILNREQLIKGINGEVERYKAYLTAHCTPFLMQDFLKLDKPLTHLPGDSAEKIGRVRITYQDYIQDESLDYKVSFC